MKGVFISITNEEKENILSKHKTLYDGYAVRNETSNTQPLYVQDFANDKQGVTVNSNGEVSSYNPKIYMRESKEICPECGLYEDVCECGYKEVKGIGGSDDFDYVEEEEMTGAECDECGDMYEEELSSDYLDDETMEEEFKGKLKESLDMFKRFKKYN